MKNIPNIVGGLLGLAFLIFGVNHFADLFTIGGSPPAKEWAGPFFKAMGGSGFMDFIKIIEIVGGILVAIPKTRNFGLIALGPIVIGILATNIFVMGGGKVFAPPVIAISVMAAYLLWNARAKFLNLLNN